MRHFALAGLILALCATFDATLTAPVRAASTPTKQTVMVPMRDGIHLAPDIRLPAGDEPWPVALVRTPYDKRDLDGTMVAQFARNGIVFVVQAVRGRYASEGKALPCVDGRESGDEGLGFQETADALAAEADRVVIVGIETNSHSAVCFVTPNWRRVVGFLFRRRGQGPDVQGREKGQEPQIRPGGHPEGH